MHPMDDNLVGYLLDALDADTRRAVEDHLRTHPEARARLDRLRRLLEPLEADREPPAPPPHLVQATLARVAEARGRPLPFAPRPSSGTAGGREWRRPDFLVAAAMLLISVGLGATWVVKLWQRSSVTACKENLHNYHQALVAYTEQRDDRAFPRVEETGPRSFAGVFVPVLADAGLLGDDLSLTCPANGRRAPSRERDQMRGLEQWYATDRDRYDRAVRDMAGGYAYSLGYREGGGLCVLRRVEGEDLQPILADCPPFPGTSEAIPGNSLNHGGTGQNVLFVGGAVRYVTNRTAGRDDDDIYLNLNQRIRAGVHERDTVLGASDARP